MAASPKTFFGQPRALAFLAFTEAWERFSYYGMASLMVLYMTEALFLPGHAGHIAGFTAYRALFGPASTLALASQTYGLYTGFVYFTPVLGGWIADRFLGRHRAVMLGAAMMSAGHVAMAFDASFLFALLLLVLGCGLLKGNISTQVGQLYAEDDGAGRARGFSIFSVAINVGSVTGPLGCGLLAQLYGWHAGFALAGVLMLFGLATYAAGYRHLGETQERRPAQARARLGDGELKTVAALFAVMALTIFQSVAEYQSYGMGLVWIKSHVDLGLFGWTIPVPWFASLDGFVSIVFVPVLFRLWRRTGEPGEIAKIATGAALVACANLVLALASLAGGRVGALVPVLYCTLIGTGFLYYWPTLLALVSRAAPVGLKSTLMGAAFLTLFVSNLTIGWLGTFYERMSAAAFWSMHAAIAAAGVAVALAARRPLARIFAEAA